MSLRRRRPAGPGAAAYERAIAPPSSTPWRQAAFCVVDLETTGLRPGEDEIISIGAVPIEAGRIVAARQLYRLARPERDLPAASIEIHGIRPSDLADAPPLAEGLDALAGLLAGRVLVAHAIWVERGFLTPAFKTIGTKLRGPMADTSALGQLWLHERDGRAPGMLSLTTLATALGLPVHRPHHALGDALTTAQAFLALATHLDASDPQTVGSLARGAQRLASLQVFHPHG